MNKILIPIDNILNKVTMYRLMLYYLLVLYVVSILLSFVKILPHNPLDLISTGVFITTVCFVTNQALSRLLKLRPNFESQLITAYIIVLIVGPLPLVKNIVFLTAVAIIAMASKYLIAYKKQHIFNPAAFAVVATALFMGQGASWWIGDKIMLPFILIGGILMVYKMRRFNLIVGFLLTYVVFLIGFNIKTFSFVDLPSFVFDTALSPVVLFFTFVMLTEPITSPANRKLRTYFGVFTGFIYAVYVTHLSTLFYSLELALVSANLLFRLISFSKKYILELVEKKEIAPGIWEFIFRPTTPLSYSAGQYMEWSVPHSNTDSRGNRRYFTIASSPTEKDIDLSVRIPDNSSSYKKALLNLKSGDKIFATNLEGEFVLPKNQENPLVFIAGGIGITPFISHLKYLLDKNIKFPITLFYIAKERQEFVYGDILNDAESKLGIKVVYVLSENAPSGWIGEVGRLNIDTIKKYIKDINSSVYYISGPQPMVSAYKNLLKDIGIKNSKIKSDYFPGYDESYAK